jgi:proteasome lid subunit RPN8/RPN11
MPTNTLKTSTKSSPEMAKRIEFSTATMEGIRAHLLSTFPEEGCGFLLGTESETRTVTHYLIADNVQESNRERRFSIRPEDYLLAEQFAAENELSLLGIYHSHPNHPAIPSGTDLENAVPWFSYLIVTTTAEGSTVARSWQLDEAQAFEEEILLELSIVSSIKS